MTDDELLAAVRSRGSTGRWTDLPGGGQPPAPATRAAVHAAEQALGYEMPALLRRLYTEIADGGVGPRAGMDGVSEDNWSTVSNYLAYHEAELEPGVPPPPPRGVFFLCDFGCATWVLLDCREPQGRMWWWDQGERHKLDLTFRQWLQSWLDGHFNTDLMCALRVDDEESWVWPDEP
ncbi:hypothetical protein ABH931_007461 [Streptacidiphilus sp. MAP12-33]|uniref:SMI1/KNR4 family protein n=1 Tax=Streptacidiphilus sp. MAP12-33 TaxID=3156266 RepID=UPI0035167D4F